eukprot:IDg7266t1
MFLHLGNTVVRRNSLAESFGGSAEVLSCELCSHTVACYCRDKFADQRGISVPYQYDYASRHGRAVGDAFWYQTNEIVPNDTEEMLKMRTGVRPMTSLEVTSR